MVAEKTLTNLANLEHFAKVLPAKCNYMSIVNYQEKIHMVIMYSMLGSMSINPEVLPFCEAEAGPPRSNCPLMCCRQLE